MNALLNTPKTLVDFSKLSSESRPSRPTLITLVVYFSVTSPQCLRLLPHLQSWQQRYASAGLGIVVAHAPQFSFEQAPGYLMELSTLLDPTWPVAPIKTRPSQLFPQIQFVTNDGTILHTVVGADQCVGLEPFIRSALTSLGQLPLPPETQSGKHEHQLGAQCFPSQPDSFTGSVRGHYKNTHRVANGTAVLTDPLDMATFGLSLNGRWNLSDDSVHSTQQPSKADYMSFVFAGFVVNAVIEPLGPTPATITLTLNGKALRSDQIGSDVHISEGLSTSEISTPRLYQLFQSQQYVAPADLRLRCTQGQIAVYLVATSGCRPQLDA